MTELETLQRLDDKVDAEIEGHYGTIYSTGVFLTPVRINAKYYWIASAFLGESNKDGVGVNPIIVADSIDKLLEKED